MHAVMLATLLIFTFVYYQVLWNSDMRSIFIYCFCIVHYHSSLSVWLLWEWFRNYLVHFLVVVFDLDSWYGKKISLFCSMNIWWNANKVAIYYFEKYAQCYKFYYWRAQYRMLQSVVHFQRNCCSRTALKCLRKISTHFMVSVSRNSSSSSKVNCCRWVKVEWNLCTFKIIKVSTFLQIILSLSFFVCQYVKSFAERRNPRCTLFRNHWIFYSLYMFNYGNDEMPNEISLK